MQAKSWILMRILLNRFHGKNTKEFLSLLPPEESKQILMQDVLTSEIDPVFVRPREFLKNIHFSWIVPHMQKFPGHIQDLLVSALPEPLASGLKKSLKIQTDRIPLPPRAGAFFVKKLFDQVQEPEILASHFLPPNELSILLDFSRKDLVNLIDYLGLYDLTEEIRHMVNKKDLQTIYACLDQKKMQFVRMCLHQKAKIVPQKIDLQKWNGNCEELHNTLHKRGLYRLGKALSGSHPHFFWHFSHKLDVGRGKILEKYYKTEPSPGVTSALVQQIMNVINFLKPKS